MNAIYVVRLFILSLVFITFAARSRLYAATAPSILTSPASQSVSVGTDVTLTVVAAGSEPLKYQWRKGSTVIAGATNESYVIVNAQMTNAGSYTVVVSNGVNPPATSAPAILAVTPIPMLPLIVSHPTNLTVIVGGAAIFTVVATGFPAPTYQWVFDTNNLIAGTNATLIIRDVTTNHTGIYCVVVRNSLGFSVSEQVRLTAIERPTILTQPVSQSVNSPLPLTTDDLAEMALAGKTLLMRIAGGTGPFPTNGGFEIILSAEGNTYSIPASGATPASSGTWAIENGGFAPVLSLDHSAPEGGRAEITLLSNQGYSINVENPFTHQNGSWLIAGEGARPTVTFSVETAGSPVTYRWLFNGKALGANPSISGSDSTTLTISNVTSANAGKYSVLVTNLAGRVTSTNAVLTVNGSAVPDVVKPVVTIASPPVSLTRVFTNLLQLNGTAKDSGGIAAVFVQVNSGDFVQVPGTTNWFTVVELKPGTNTLHVQAFDRTGNVSPMVTRTIFYVVTERLRLTAVGEGHFAPPNLTDQDLEIGRNYKLTAIPEARNLFSNWIVAGISHTNAVFTFPMSSNLALTAYFVTNPFIALKGSYLGLFSDTNQPSHENAGSISFTLTDQGGYSGRILSKVGTLPLSGKFGLDLAARKSAGTGSNALALSLQLIGDSDYFTGSVSNAEINSSVDGYRAVYSAAHPATNFSGRYTTLFVVAEDNSIAFGQGFAAMEVTKPGHLVLTGGLPDGTTLQQSVVLGPQGETAWYFPLYTGKGSLFGWLTNGNPEDLDVAGTLYWTRKSGAPGPRYPEGFTNSLITFGSRYAVPVAGMNATSLTNAEIVLGGGGLVNTNLLDEPIRLQIGARNKITVKGTNTYRLALTLQAATGLFNGSFYNPDTRQINLIRGALLQGIDGGDMGAGFFLNTNRTGSMFFGPESIPTTNTFTP